MTSVYLVDASALEQLGRSAEAIEVLDYLREQGAIAVCDLVALEVLYSARNGAEQAKRRSQLSAFRSLAVTSQTLQRAVEVQRLLTECGKHREVRLPALIIAAIAELNNATVLHYDTDYDLIAEVTGQPTRWVVPRGSVE